MRTINKLQSAIAVLMICVVVISLLLSGTVIKHSDEMNNYILNYINTDSYKKIYIRDSKGIPIYNGTFSSDETIRKSMFHLIGDKNGSIPSSLLTQTAENMYTYNKYTGYSIDTKEINLTIDISLQIGAYKTLEDSGYDGCIAVIDYKTGEIKAMVSMPTIDVYDTTYIKEGAFLNKATSLYPPGSVFKAVTAGLLLEKSLHIRTKTFECNGTYSNLVCFDHISHGTVDLSSALNQSCNCAIGTFAKTFLTPAELNEFTHTSGIINDDIITDFPINKGNINAEDDLGWSANGQSKDMVTPIGVALYYGTIANKGMQHPLKIKSDTENKTQRRILSERTCSYIIEALAPVSRNAGIGCYSFGKTGTAELDDDVSHAWFACSLCDENVPTYTIVTFLEHGDKSQYAKSLTADFINNYILEGGNAK